jgi:RimJ/RimL family protein N-acetyltransferase
MMVLRTERLISRKLRMDDAQAIFEAYATDPLVARFMTWRVHRGVQETESFVTAPLCRARWFQMVAKQDRKDSPQSPSPRAGTTTG